jgi:ribosome-associated protein
MIGRELAEKIAELIASKKGYNIKIIDLNKISSFTDYFVICSADSDIQVKAIADEVDNELRKLGVKPLHSEGAISNSWVLIDYVDVVAHIFKHETRLHYSLEKLWGDAPIVAEYEIKQENGEQF